MEHSLVQWLSGRLGFDPALAGGVFTHGGSAGNLTALLAARQASAPYDVWEQGYQTPAGPVRGRVGPGPLLGPPGRPDPGPGRQERDRGAHRRALPDAGRPARAGPEPGGHRRPAGDRGGGQRRLHRHRRHRPPGRHRRPLPGAGPVAARGRGPQRRLRRLGAAAPGPEGHRAGPVGGHRRPQDADDAVPGHRGPVPQRRPLLRDLQPAGLLPVRPQRPAGMVQPRPPHPGMHQALPQPGPLRGA